MKVRYIGPLEAVVIDDLGVVVESGEVVDVADDLGARMCEQPSNWVAADGVPAESSAVRRNHKAAAVAETEGA